MVGNFCGLGRGNSHGSEQSAKIREANIRKGNSGQAEKKKSGKVERKGIPQQSHKLQKIPV